MRIAIGAFTRETNACAPSKATYTDVERGVGSPARQRGSHRFATIIAAGVRRWFAGSAVRFDVGRAAGQALLLMAVMLSSACITLVEERAVVRDPRGQTVHAALGCNDSGARAIAGAQPGALDPDAIRLITWNIHKNGDKGWDHDLERFVTQHTIVLLQEARLNAPLRTILERAGHDWVLASAFLMNERDTGVLSAAAVTPLAACLLRQTEPIIGLPKTTLVTRYALAGSDATLLVANIHSINVSPAIGAYSAQLDALAKQLQRHRGPLILAGDLNTWTAGRREYVDAIARRLGLREVLFERDRRSRFWGRQVDHIFVRGLDVVQAEVIEVASSDHNPVRAVLRVMAEAD